MFNLRQSMSCLWIAVLAASPLACGGGSPRAEGPRTVSSELVDAPPKLTASVDSDDTGLHLVLTAADTCRIVRESGFPEGGYIRRTETAACNQHPAANEPVGLRFPGHSSVHLALGTTDAEGHLDVKWIDITDPLPTGAGATANLYAGNPARPVGTVSLAPVIENQAERAWRRALASGSAEDFAAFRRRFPDRHVEEARKRYTAARTAELAEKVDAALAEKDYAQAEALLEEWNQLAPGDPRRIELAARFAGEHHEHQIDELTAQFDAACKTAELGGAAEIDALAAAAKALAELRQIAARDRRTLERIRTLSRLKAKRVKEHLAKAKRALRHHQLDRAESQLATAEAIEPGNREVARQRAALERARK